MVVISLALALGLGNQCRTLAGPYESLSLGFPVNHVAVIGDSYTSGTDEGGRGPKAWTTRAWQTLARQGVQVAPDVASECRAGYAVRGDHGSIFEDLTARAVHPTDTLVVFFGSRNDQHTNPGQLAEMAHSSFDLAHRAAPSTRLLVIGPPWPTVDPPDALVHVRDVLVAQAAAVGATFADPIAESWFVGRPDLIGADGVHPNDAGHAYMAKKIVSLVRAQLPPRI
jgi:lysophospholipase L1-like esterase